MRLEMNTRHQEPQITTAGSESNKLTALTRRSFLESASMAFSGLVLSELPCANSHEIAKESSGKTATNKPFPQLPEVGSIFPKKITLLDLKDRSISLDDQWKPTLNIVHFWSSYCGPCKADVPVLSELVETYRGIAFSRRNLGDVGTDLKVIGISVDEDPEKWREAVNSNSLVRGWGSNLLDLDWEVCHSVLGVGALPKNILVSNEGKVLAITQNARQIRRILKGLATNGRS